MRRILLIAASLAVACSTAGAPVNDSKPLVTESNPAPEWLVWQRTDDGFQTHQVQQAGDGFEVVKTYPDLRIAVGESIWTYVEYEETVTEADCDCMMQAFNQGKSVEDGECAVSSTKTFVKLEELDGEGLWTPDVIPEDSPESEYEPGYSVTGSLGSKVFVTTCVNQYGCGAAHPASNCKADIVDLETLEAVSPGEVFEPVANPEALKFDTDEIDVDAAGVEFAEVRTDFRADEVLLDHLYITDTCYACTDGSWGSYTTGTVVEDQRVEGAQVSDARLPPALVEFVKTVDSDKLGGWSRLR